MKWKIYFFAVWLILCEGAMNAQILSGTVLYEVKIDVHAQLPPEMEELKLRIPRYQTAKKELFFRQTESLFKDYIDDSETGRMNMFRMMGGNSILYADLEEETFKEKRGFFGEDFLIEGEFKRLPWRIAPETKSIMGYTCQRAWHISPDSAQKYVEAWFTMDIPVSAGPDHYRGLPGLILELDIEYGETNYLATQISTKAPKDGEFKLPKGGKPISKEDYEAFVKEKTEEMRQRGGSQMRSFRRN